MDEAPTFTKASRWRHGYEPSQVDAFRARLERDLAGRRDGRAGELGSEDVSGVQFDTVLGGYEMEKVDTYLDWAEAELATADPAGPVPTISPGTQQEAQQGSPQVSAHGTPPPQSGGLRAAPAAGSGQPADHGQSANATAPADWNEALRERGELLQLLREPVGQRFARCGRLSRGYRVEDVDRFVDTVGASIRTIQPEAVRSVQFGDARGGYDEDAVDAWLDRVEAHVVSSSSF